MFSPDYNPILGSLYSKLLEFTDNMVRKLKDTAIYKDYREILNEIELLPVAYLNYRYPFFDQLQWYYLPDTPDPDNYDDNVSFSEDMEEWQDKADQFEKAFPEGLASASAFYNNLGKITLQDVEDYIRSYATCKRLDLEHIDYVIDEYQGSNQDLNWLSKVKEKCNEPIEREAFDNPFVLPIYLRYRNNWLFDYIQGYANNRNNEYLGRAEEINKKVTYSCMVKQFYDKSLFVQIEEVRLIFTVDERKDIVRKLMIEVKSVVPILTATVLECSPDTTRLKTAHQPDPKYRITYPDMMPDCVSQLSQEHLKLLYYVITNHKRIETKAMLKSGKAKTAQDINTFMRKILPIENVKSFQFITHKSGQNNFPEINKGLDIKVINLSGKKY